jgi:hypothetical protein
MKKLLLLCLAGALASCATTKPLPARSAADRSETYWQPTPTPAESLGAPRAEPGSQADFIRRIFEGHPPVAQLELEAESDSLPFVHVPLKNGVTKESKKKTAPAASKGLFSFLKRRKETKENPLALPGKCKNCQITVQLGNGNTSGQASTEKKGQTLGAGASNVEKAKAPVATNAGTAQDYTKQAQRGGAAASGDHAQATATKPSGWPWWLWLLLVVGAVTGIYRLYKRFSPT